jgi:hypothetical protein
MRTAHVIDPPLPIELRAYQRDAFTAVEAAALRGVRHAQQKGTRGTSGARRKV